LLLTSAGLSELITSPPPAALEAVECCGRLALALPIAGGMIRELEDVWQAELVPMLKEELSDELSTEATIVNASLRCVDKKEKAGVDALFAIMGVFAEDEVVPAAVLDVLAPLVCKHAGLGKASRAHLKARKWLQTLLRSSLLSGSVVGVSVHDLVREVMMSRAELLDGGMVGLQREVLTVLLGAYDDAALKALQSFILRSIRHHAAHALLPDQPLAKDALLMALLGHTEKELVVSAVVGIGLARVDEEITACETGVMWLAAAVLGLASATAAPLSDVAPMASRAWDAIRQLDKVEGGETEQTRAIEKRLVPKILYSGSDKGVKIGSPEYLAIVARGVKLGADGATVDAMAPSVANFDVAYGKANAVHTEAITGLGIFYHVPKSLKQLQATWPKVVAAARDHTKAVLVAPDLARTIHAATGEVICVGQCPNLHWLHTLGEEYDMFEIIGPAASKNRLTIEKYDFDAIHEKIKTEGVSLAIDIYLMAPNEVSLLLFCGGEVLETCKKGWQNQLYALTKINEIIAAGKRKWSDYYFECYWGDFIRASAMYEAGEIALVREWLEVSMLGHAMRDPTVAAEVEAMVPIINFKDEASGHIGSTASSLMIFTKALAALVQEGGADSEALRAWLPDVDELLQIDELEFFWNGQYGASPSTLCGTLYGTVLGEWDKTLSIAERLLAIDKFKITPPTRVNAWRLLARARGNKGDTAAARAALESALSEARSLRYVWHVECVEKEIAVLGGHGWP